MQNALLVGVDIGTQGVKAAVFDDAGHMLGKGFRKSEILQDADGVTEEEPETQYQNVCSSIKEALDSGNLDPAKVAAIGIDGQMAGIIGIYSDLNPLTKYDSWLDTRCEPYIEKMRREGGKRVTELTGNAPSINHGPKVLWWKHERPEVYRKIRKFIQPGGYVAMRLTGLSADQAFIDDSYIHFSGFADNRNRQWSDELLDMFDVERDKMPRIVSPSETIGKIDKQAAGETGLLEGTPVVAGCGDTAASFLAAGAVEPGICVDVSGTASVFAATTSEYVPDIDEKVLGLGRSAVPGLWHPYAYVNGGGLNIEWFRDVLLQVLQGASKDSSRGGGSSASAGSQADGAQAGGAASAAGLDFDDLNRMAAEISAEEDLPVFIPHFGGRVSPGQPQMRGAWLGLRWTHGPGHLYRAILESIALEYSIYLSQLKQLNPGLSVAQLRNTGGGNVSSVWKQIKADALGVPLVDIRDFAGATHGAAMLAGFGAGVLPDLRSAAARWVKTGETTDPDNGYREHYDRRIDRYTTSLKMVLDLMDSWK
ncbi:MAG: hypothetical protein K9L68_11060 [Spirochaetales bacterium]|nr:hypothetical protein [Spirochaetales bacterium]MCF7939125.1 hypothetical protein [Spirochaetales bacterium]